MQDNCSTKYRNIPNYLHIIFLFIIIIGMQFVKMKKWGNKMNTKNYARFLSLVSLLSLASCNNSRIRVIFKLNNGDADITMEINKGTTITTMPIANKYGCNFLSYQKDGSDFDFNNPINEDMTLCAHYEYNRETLLAPRTHQNERHDSTTNLRIMTYNLLSSVFDYHPMHHGYNEKNEPYDEGVNDGRDVQAFKTIMCYMPDVIGLQECDLKGDVIEEESMPANDTGWYNLFLAERTKTGSQFPYKIINEDKPKFDGTHTLFSTIAYNSNTIELETDEDGKECYGSRLSMYSDNDYCRALTWAVFHLKNDNSKKFMVTSTHWNLKSTCTPEDRVAQAKESALFTLTKQTDFGGIPVITTGDYNRDETTDPYAAFIATSQFKDSKYDATERGFVGISYHLGDGTEEGKYYRTDETLLRKDPDAVASIDHLFLSKDVKCHYYDMVPERDALHSSDHMPSYIDITI